MIFLSFYTGAKNYFRPASRLEEIVLLLLISELLASRRIRASNNDDETFDRMRLVHNLKKVHNLLALVSLFTPMNTVARIEKKI